MGALDLDPPPPLAHSHFTRRQRRLGVMNPETRLILDELTKRFNEQDAKWDSRFADQDARLARQIADLEKSQASRMESLERATASIEEWRPSIDGAVDDIRLQVSKTKLEVSKISRHWERAVLEQPATSPGVFAAAPDAVPSAVERPHHGAPATSPNGHRVDNHHRESGFGVVSTLVHSPVKGMPVFPLLHPLFQFCNLQ